MMTRDDWMIKGMIQIIIATIVRVITIKIIVVTMTTMITADTVMETVGAIGTTTMTEKWTISNNAWLS